MYVHVGFKCMQIQMQDMHSFFFIHLIHFAVSDLFDVNINSTVEEMSKKTEIRIPWGSGIVGHVAASGRPVNITDCYADERFNPVSHQFPFIFFFS